jgi:hypothetical protein
VLLPAYEPPAADGDTLLDQEREMIVELVGLSFVPGHKWRVSDGAQTFWASIDDREFLRGVEEGIEAFRKGDMLRGRMRIIQTRRADGLHADYRIVEVIEHLPRPQLTID